MILAYVDVRPILFILGVLVLLLGVYIFCDMFLSLGVKGSTEKNFVLMISKSLQIKKSISLVSRLN